MKQSLFISFFFLLSITSAQVKFGAKGGLNSSNIREVHFQSERRSGFHLGVFAQVPLSRRGIDKLFLQPEILYSNQGEKSTIININSNEIYLNYLQIPIILKGFLNDNGQKFFWEVGPYLSFKLNENISDIGLLTNPNQSFSNFDYGGVIGAGYNFNRKYEIFARMSYGLSDAVKNETNESKNNLVAIQVGLSYIF